MINFTKEKLSGVYLVLNKKDGKFYIGSSKEN